MSDSVCSVSHLEGEQSQPDAMEIDIVINNPDEYHSAADEDEGSRCSDDNQSDSSSIDSSSSHGNTTDEQGISLYSELTTTPVLNDIAQRQLDSCMNISGDQVRSILVLGH